MLFFYLFFFVLYSHAYGQQNLLSAKFISINSLSQEKETKQ